MADGKQGLTATVGGGWSSCTGAPLVAHQLGLATHRTQYLTCGTQNTTRESKTPVEWLTRPRNTQDTTAYNTQNINTCTWKGTPQTKTQNTGGSLVVAHQLGLTTHRTQDLTHGT